MSKVEQAKSLGAQLPPQEERRRSQRVALRVPVRLYFRSKGEEIRVEACTVNVNDHGAWLVTKEAFVTNDCFILEHKFTRQRIGCRVTRMPRETSGGNEVAVEFEHPVPGFWQVVFPPTDWAPLE
jgi:hypothetical protein